MLVPLLAVSACSSGAATRDAFGRPIPARSTVEKWPNAWCAARVGETRAALRAAMGQPVEVQSDNDKWQAYQYNLLAFYNVDDTVRQLDADAGSVPCGASRT